MVRRAFRSMLDEVLEGEAVLLDSGHRLVEQILQADRLTLLLTCRGGEKIQVMSNSCSWYWLEIFYNYVWQIKPCGSGSAFL
jgi:hypothetical protein